MEQAEFVERLVNLRMDKGVSARDMSLSLGQNAGYINNIESGLNFPSMTVFFYICEYLGITPKEFFDTDIVNPAKTNELYEESKKLNSRQLNLLIALVKEMKRH